MLASLSQSPGVAPHKQPAGGHTLIIYKSPTCMRRATTLKEFFFSACKDNGEALSILNRLALDLVGQSSLSLDLCARVEAVEAALTQRLPTLQHLAKSVDEQGQPLSASNRAMALSTEAHMLAGTESRAKDFGSGANNAWRLQKPDRRLRPTL